MIDAWRNFRVLLPPARGGSTTLGNERSPPSPGIHASVARSLASMPRGIHAAPAPPPRRSCPAVAGRNRRASMPPPSREYAGSAARLAGPRRGPRKPTQPASPRSANRSGSLTHIPQPKRLPLPPNGDPPSENQRAERPRCGWPRGETGEGLRGYTERLFRPSRAWTM